MLATLAGILLAVLIVLAGRLVWRLLRGIGALLRVRPRGPRRRSPGRRVRPLRGLRLRRSRAMLRAEGERSARLTAEVRRLRAELALARAQRDAALARGGGAASRAGGHDLFQEAKREFARRFHPDRLPAGAPDRALRGAIFREFWAVLRRIERGR
jgi:hypothetical protein